MEHDGDGCGSHGGDGEVDEEGGVVECPGKEEDLGGGAFCFGGADDGGYGFEIVLGELVRVDWEEEKDVRRQHQ